MNYSAADQVEINSVRKYVKLILLPHCFGHFSYAGTGWNLNCFHGIIRADQGLL